MNPPITLQPEDCALILGCIDTLSCLVPCEHQWTEGERAVYEQAVMLLGGRVNLHEDDDEGEEWKKPSVD